MKSRGRKKKARRPADKARCQRLHAYKRSFQRHGVSLTRARHDAIVDQIKKNHCELIERQSLRVSMWRAEIAPGLFAPVVYDKQRKTIVTVLEWEMLEAKQQEG